MLDAGGATTAAVLAGTSRLRDLGLLPIVVTGRSLPGFLRLAGADPLLTLFHPEVLLEDGDVVLDRAGGHCRTAATLPLPAVDQVVRACADVVASCDGGRLVASSRRAAAAYAMAYRIPRRDIDVAAPAGPVSRLVVFDAAPADVAGTRRRPLNAFDATVFTAAGRGKATGLADLLAERFGEQDLSRVVAFGDGDNDADLLAASRVGVAVQGCSTAARAAARVCLDRPLGAYLETVDPRDLLRCDARQTR
ncbi:HAD family hydrolase [Streptomyces sp. NPDC018584]|uniref:HAD family hydrolase n=1 Tax=unclassified Streptomyces TaxID=2593676 RepID=UPI00378B2058